MAAHWWAPRPQPQRVRHVAKRTIQRYILAVRPPGDGQSKKTLPEEPRRVGLRLRADLRHWVHCAFGAPALCSGRGPLCYSSTAWTACTPARSGVRVLREGASIRVVRTAVEWPLMNATCERFVGSARRECLAHVIIPSETRLKALLERYAAYFKRARPHQGLQQRIPVTCTIDDSASGGRVVVLPVFGRLRHVHMMAV